MEKIWILIPFLWFLLAGQAFAKENFLLKMKTKNKYERTKLVELGIAVHYIDTFHSYAMVSEEEVSLLKKNNISFVKIPHLGGFGFPSKDQNYHDYKEMESKLQALAQKCSDIFDLNIIGVTHEKRNMYRMTITSNKDDYNLPETAFMGGHHAREHLSVEIPLLFINYICDQYQIKDTRVLNILASRRIHVIPMVNPDGAEFDIKGERYKYWRKNRRKNFDGTMGVDLNRNYGFKWSHSGSSSRTNSDVYHGPNSFSEPESQAIRDFLRNNPMINTMISFHSFSELILYPWGYEFSPISNQKDRETFVALAKKMSKWNNYKPMQAADLYAASGDTVDWAYFAHGIFGFTFELDPKSSFSFAPGAGFYPGDDIIPQVFNKNIEPMLYLIEVSDNPYKVITPSHKKFGLNSPLIK